MASSVSAARLRHDPRHLAVVAAAVAFGLAASACTVRPIGHDDIVAGRGNATPIADTHTCEHSAHGRPRHDPDNGVDLHFLVDEASTGVIDAYKTGLRGQGLDGDRGGFGGWQGAGAAYTATQGDTYGVFTGGGPKSPRRPRLRWPSKPANPDCGGGSR